MLNCVRGLMLIVLLLLAYIGVDLLEEGETPKDTRYEVHAIGQVFYCDHIQKVDLDAIGYGCGDKAAIEIRSPHVIIHNFEQE